MSSICIATTHERAIGAAMRQSEDGAGGWGDLRFRLNDPDCDAVFVLDDAPPGFVTRAPRERRALVVTEPPDFRAYPKKFLAQFGTVLAPFEFDAGAPLIKTQTALNWWYGLAPEGGGPALTLHDLRALRPAEKQPVLSVVCSGKRGLAKHRARLAFLDFLQARMGERLRVFGRGFEPVADKAQAIAPYQYHLVLENNDLGCFWTEKLADAFLGWSLPFFSGGPNVAADFPAGALVPIDIASPDEALRRILSAMESGQYEKRLPLIEAARARVLEEHNLFALLSRHAADLPPGRLDAPEHIQQAFGQGWLAGLRLRVRGNFYARKK